MTDLLSPALAWAVHARLCPTCAAYLAAVREGSTSWRLHGLRCCAGRQMVADATGCLG